MVNEHIVFEFIKMIYPLVFYGALATAIYGMIITINEAD